MVRDMIKLENQEDLGVPIFSAPDDMTLISYLGNFLVKDLWAPLFT